MTRKAPALPRCASLSAVFVPETSLNKFAGSALPVCVVVPLLRPLPSSAASSPFPLPSLDRTADAKPD